MKTNKIQTNQYKINKQVKQGQLSLLQYQLNNGLITYSDYKYTKNKLNHINTVAVNNEFD